MTSQVSSLTGPIQRTIFFLLTIMEYKPLKIENYKHKWKLRKRPVK